MKSIFGTNIIISLFGESHEKTMGVTINGLKAGIELDFDLIKKNLSRRRPSKDNETPRIEEDHFEVISGYFNNKTTSAPLTILLYNEKHNSSNYKLGEIRPSSSDYPSYIRSHGFNDYRGSGHYSGRITALLVIAGSICLQILSKQNIEISSKIIYAGHEKNDSTGGVIRAMAKNVPIGLGEGFFDSVESILSHLFFSIPSVKAVDFGGVDMAYKLGSEVVDEIKYDEENIVFLNNFNCGINGGLSNGNDIISNIYFKPIPTINKPVQTINIVTKENIILTSSGQHDSSHLRRCLVIVEAAMAIGLIELLSRYHGLEWM